IECNIISLISSLGSLREKLCAFCYCGEKSLLGQGELKLFGPTPGYVPLHIRNRRGSSEKDDDYHDDDNDFDDSDNNHSPGAFHQRGAERVKVLRVTLCLIVKKQHGVTRSETFAGRMEHTLVGINLADGVYFSVASAGQCCAHLRCAAWSEGVCRGEGQSLLYVDKAIDSGSTECCAYCKRLGASIKCCEESCGRSFHYPCAAAAGTFQDIKAYTLLCPDHIQQALVRFKDTVNCLVCDSSGDLLDQLFCCTCGQHYHGACLDITVTPLKRAGWQCPECKVCLTCKNPGDDSKMLVCDTCDKGYHTFCLQPIVETIPTNGWRCKNCRTCAQCGVRPNGQWSSNGVMCEGCQQQHDSALVCLTCGQNQASGHPLDKHSCCTSLPALPTKETSPKHSRAQEEEPMDVCPSDPSSMKDKRMTSVPEAQSVVEEVEQGQKQDKQHFSSFSSPIEDKSLILKHSPGLSSEGSTKLTQSPFSTEASPRETSQSQTPTHVLNLSGYSPSVSNTTFFPLTPKIGMGKPAISKRKFSPGRPRVKQVKLLVFGLPFLLLGSWFSFDLFRTLILSVIHSFQPHSNYSFALHYSNMLQTAGCDLSKCKPMSCVLLQVSLMDSPYVVKEEEENSMHNTVVLFSASDSFTLKQDMCVVCGSFGQGAEGRLLACSQCGQCYHPFCVNIKITKVVLSKGWRCLECTVCEACGQASDPGRLLLCDDCDISYHTYCLDPPLQNVPKGSWKCKWCVLCTHCGATSPGQGCEWQNNYTQCGPCASLTVCPACARSYREEELILQCRQCDRWVHASCQGLNSDEEVESAADEGFDCSLCRTHTMSTPVEKLMDINEPPVVAQILTKVKENEFQRTYTQDGVCLTESGLCQLQSLCVQTARRRRSKPKLKLKIINQNSVAVLQTPPDPQPELFRDGDLDDSREGNPMDCDGKSDSSPEREHCDDHLKGVDGSDSNKKRKRKPYRPGIGGFMVRQRSKAGQGKAKHSLSRKDSTSSLIENFTGKEGWNEPDTPVDGTPIVSEPLEKVKKRYRKKKTKLEEAFPSYLQEAFFGKALLDKSKQTKSALETGIVEEEASHADSKSQSSSFLDPLSDPLLSTTSTPISSKAGPLPNVEDPLTELVLHSDDDLLGMLSDDLVKPAGLDIGTLPDDQSAPPQPGPARGSRPLQEEPLDVILSPELDKMVSDGKSHGLLMWFFCVLVTSVSHVKCTAHFKSACFSMVPFAGDVGGMFPRMPMMNGMMGPNTHFPPSPVNPGAGVSGTLSSIHRGDMIGPWASPVPVPGSGPPLVVETDTMSNAQRSTLKWEKEETLGEMATVAPVLYTNMNFPNLQDDFPDWATRVKQIAKLWRKASSQERAPYVQKARDNRAALRINKVQLSNDTMKIQQQQQPADLFDPSIPIDTELLFKDPLKHKESEHEQEWKFRQQMRQKSKQQAKIEATQKLEQVKNEQQQLQKQQQQQFSGDNSKSGNQSPVTTQPTSGGNDSPLQTLTPKDCFTMTQMPGTATSVASTDDVFVRPQPPLPSSTAKTPTKDTQYPQVPSSQPQSPQMFSPESSGSRPSSPWDPYSKMVGTPRPPPSGSSTPCRGSVSDMQERSRPSPAHESFGSPTSLSTDPYAKPPDTPRPSDLFVKPMCPPRPGPLSEQQGRHFISNITPGDSFSRPGLRSEAYQRMAHSRMVLSDPYSRPLLTPIPGSNESGSVTVFKTPIPPSQLQQDSFSIGQQGMRRGSSDTLSQVQHSDPYSHQPLTPHPSMGDGFSNEGRMMRPGQGSPFAQPLPMSRHTQRDLYSQAPSTPRPDYLQQMPDPYAQPPGTPRPHDPYAQMPGTPRPHSDPYTLPSTPRTATIDQFSQSQPNSCRQSPSHPSGTPRPVLTDPYSQPPGTPHPEADPEAFPRQNPRVNFMSHQTDPLNHQAQRMQDPFVRPCAPDSQTPKHPGISDESLSLQQTNPNQTPTHDPFEQAPLTPCSQTGERLSHDVPVNTGNPSDTQNTMQPLLGETEEKMKQRQRLRQLILKQQQQKSAIRQEKGLQEAAPAAAPGTPRHWSQDDSGTQNDIFGRPPPPYPGTMRPAQIHAGQRFPGTFLANQRGPMLDEPQCSRLPFPRILNNTGMSQQGQRFGSPPGAPCQEHFLRPPHQIQGGPMVDSIPPHMRRPVDFVRSIGSNHQLGLPQHFPPRGLPVQQHNIMGQPFIELCHRAPENRVRLPFGPPNALDNSNHSQRPSNGFMLGQNMAFTGNQGPRIMDPMLGQSQQGSVNQLQTSATMDNLLHHTNAAQQQTPLPAPLSHSISSDSVTHAKSAILPVTTPGSTEEIPLPCSGVEKLETDDSAVKDLDDVEVKDLVDEDLDNLNLDADDGKDIDLETNDLHLDDLLKSGKFDLLAYADPELNLEDKKDMFNEELELSDHIEDDHGDTSDLQKGIKGPSDVKHEKSLSKEVQDHSQSENIKTEGQGLGTSVDEHQPMSSKSGQDDVSRRFEESCADVHAGSAPVLSSLLIKEKLEDTRSESIISPIPGDPNSQTNLGSNMSMVMLQGQPQEHRINPGVTMGHRIDPALTQEALLGNANLMLSGNQQVPLQGFGPSEGQHVDLNLVGGQHPVPHPVNPQTQQGMFNSGATGQQGSQAQQSQQNRPLLLDEQPLLLQELLDQERQEQQQQRQMQAMIRQRSSDPFFPNIDFDAITDPIMKAKMVALKGINKVMVQNSMGMTPMLPPQIARPSPPNFGPGFVNDSQRKQYEEWLQETQQLLQMQQKFLEDQIGAHRKSKKALSAKQRTAKKAGREFPEEDAEQLKHVTEQQSVVQKQLEQIRKQQKEHAELIEEYRVKQQQQQQRLQPGVMGPMKAMPGIQGRGPGMMPVGPQMGQPMMGSMLPMQQPHFGKPTHMPNVPGWHSGATGPVGGARMPPHLPPQMPLPNPTQPLQAQPPSPMVPGGKPGQPGTVAGDNGGGSSSSAPHVKFDDNNPFSEGFQERERRERLREQQEKQRVQLMQEVERQRALQRLELEQQGLGLVPDNSGGSLAQMPFYNSDLSQEFMQTPRPQQQLGPVFSQQRNMPLDFVGPSQTYLQGGEHRSMPGNGSFGPDMGPNFQPKTPMMHGFSLGQPRAPGFGGHGMPPHSGGEASSFSMDSTTPLPPNFPGSGQSLIQLYSNIIPEEKGKKKRSRKKKLDDDADSVKTPSTPHSDITAPLTPCVSDTSSTPAHSAAIMGDQDTSEFSNTLSSMTGLQPSSELENPLSGGTSLGQQSSVGLEAERGLLHEIKLEKLEASVCQKAEVEAVTGHNAGGASIVKTEEGNEIISPTPPSQSPSQTTKVDTGNELLKHLLKNKSTPSLSSTPHQMPKDSTRSEDEGLTDSKGSLRLDSTDSSVRQNNLSNPPTPPASLPPTPPPVAKQKLLNGFATAEELTRKAEVMVSKSLGQKQLTTPFRAEDDLLGHTITQGPKTVDVPASLPTPPHNNQEELRGQEHCVDRDTPDSYIPSSSPESVVGMEISRYPDLSRVKEEPPSPAVSPVIPIICSASGKGSEARQWEVKTEPPSSFFASQFEQLSACSQTDLVSVSVTLNPVAAQVSVCSVMVRPDYQMGGSSPGPRPQWCSHCRVVVLGNGVRKSIKDLPINKQFSVLFNNISDLDVHCLAQLQHKQSPPPTPMISFPSITSETLRGDSKSDTLKVTVKLKPRPRAVHNSGDDPRYSFGKRFKALRWRKWSIQIMVPKGNYHLPEEEEVDELLKKLGMSLRPEPMPRDLRRCCFCHEEGDGHTDGPARLLNLDLDLWVHLNCALWSTEVYETQAGALINVELALRRGLSVHCVYCQQTGATSGCHRLRCTNAYHFTCALKAQCMFFKDKTMLCHLHRPRGTGSIGVGLAGTEHELRCFAVFRRVYVQRDDARQIASIIRRGEREHTFRVGSLVFHAVGQLLPQQMQAFHSMSAIFPVGYEASRIYWSMRHGNRRCHYVCSIDEKDGEPEFIIRVVEQGYDDLVLTGSSPKGVWDKVLEPVAERRNETGSLKLFPVYLKGEDLFGLTVSAVTRIVESLPGVEACEKYTFRYGRNPLMQLPLAINPSGCARSEPKACTHVKRFVLRPHTLTSSSSSKALQSSGNPAEMGVAPYSKQFFFSKSSQYRRMKAEWKSNVYLARSRIQGLGLYAARDIEKDTMVIEYIGTIIRNEVANRKEKMYEAQNRGVYMFRIDSEHVIDATISGGPARYINHSCAPNCIAEVVTFERDHKIIISSNRRIQRGEELCYDYKFDLEDDQHKIPCHCGAVNCRKWMN
uniref:Histone-lysine N-methyltransferase 2C n=1 Tax=Cyprinus carpio TaxID=7962 RepID=A0A8C1QMJ4_CYPCA